MAGMNAATGRDLDGVAHLRQSIRDVLLTRVGTRVGRREYGSTLLDLVDQPLTPATIVDLYAATAEALARWEPRFRLESVRATAAGRTQQHVDHVFGLRTRNGDARIDSQFQRSELGRSEHVLERFTRGSPFEQALEIRQFLLAERTIEVQVELQSLRPQHVREELYGIAPPVVNALPRQIVSAQTDHFHDRPGASGGAGSRSVHEPGDPVARVSRSRAMRSAETISSRSPSRISARR